MAQKRPDGTVGAFLRNPERNIGVFVDVDRIERDGAEVRLLGHRLGSKSEGVLLSGRYDSENGILSIFFPNPYAAELTVRRTIPTMLGSTLIPSTTS